MPNPKHTIKEILELGEKLQLKEWSNIKRGCSGDSIVCDEGELHSTLTFDSFFEPNYTLSTKELAEKESIKNYILMAPSMEAWLKEITELIPKLGKKLGECGGMHSYEAYCELKDLMKRAGIE